MWLMRFSISFLFKKILDKNMESSFSSYMNTNQNKTNAVLESVSELLL